MRNVFSPLGTGTAIGSKVAVAPGAARVLAPTPPPLPVLMIAHGPSSSVTPKPMCCARAPENVAPTSRTSPTG
jgi:hypothetical protein